MILYSTSHVRRVQFFQAEADKQGFIGWISTSKSSESLFHGEPTSIGEHSVSKSLSDGLDFSFVEHCSCLGGTVLISLFYCRKCVCRQHSGPNRAIDCGRMIATHHVSVIDWSNVPFYLG